jgi:hypothetical protein
MQKKYFERFSYSDFLKIKFIKIFLNDFETQKDWRKENKVTPVKYQGTNHKYSN